MEENNEANLIAACKRGDKTAITQLFEQHYPSSLRTADRILRSRDEALDAVQSAYLAAFRHLDTFRGDSTFKTWITRIVTNQCLMRLRQSGGVHTPLAALELVAPAASPAPTPERSMLSREIAAAISEGAAKLPPLLSQVFNLYTFSDLSVREVAAATGLTVPATKTRLFRAQLRMRQHLRDVWSGSPRAAVRRNANRHAGGVRSLAA